MQRDIEMAYMLELRENFKLAIISVEGLKE